MYFIRLNLYLLFLVVFSFSTDCKAYEQPSEAFTIIEDKAKVPILTPSFSERKTLKIRLKNGLEAFLISDPNADKSSAVMSVKTGSWEDPEEFPGIAHFLEHMLFLGTKKYPKESEYQRFVSEHGGSSNAFTSNDHTSYLFSINNDAFPEALDRFSNFFKEPLFNPSGVSRELNAIDQEYAKNVENDDIRVLFVIKELGNIHHPNHRFNIGNSQTLSKVSQETLKKWYHEHYNAHMMRLVVYSNLPLDTLTSLVSQDFQGVPDSKYTPNIPDIPLASGALEGKIVYVQSIKNVRTLTLLWDLPSVFGTMKETRPDILLCTVLGHEGKESLLNELKRQGLAEKLNCGAARIGGNHLNFYLDIDLTDEGVQKLNQVIQITFEMIKILREKGIPPYLFQETQKVEKIRYQYQKREDAFEMAFKAASTIWDEDMDTFPERGLILEKFNPKDIQAFIDQLTPQNCQFFLSAPSALTGFKPTQKEKWLGVEYTIVPIPKEVMEAWKNPSYAHSQLNLPAANSFIPEQLNIIQPPEGFKDLGKLPLVPHPKKLIDNEKGKIYYAQDERYRVPEGYWNFEIKSPEIQMGKRFKVVLADLLVKSLNESLSQFTYDASLAGLDYKIDRKEFGIQINVQGYSEKAPMLFNEILKQFKSLKVSEESFNIYKQLLLREYQNFLRDPPLKQASELLKSAIYKAYTTEQQKASAMRKITYDKFLSYQEAVFKQIYVQGVIYGNVSEQEALQLSDNFINAFQAEPYPLKDQKMIEVIALPADTGPFYLEDKIKSSGNAVILAIEYLPFSIEARAAHQVLTQALNEPFFTTLRTKQQTGYIVFSTGEDLERHLFHLFAVQSNSHDVRDLLARFELFIESFLQEIGKTELHEADFEVIKQSIITKLEQPQNNLKEMGELLTTLAFKFDGDFDWMNKRIAALKKMQYGEFLVYAKQALGRQNKRRLAVLMKGILPEDSIFNYDPLNNLSQLRRISTYQGAVETK